MRSVVPFAAVPAWAVSDVSLSVRARFILMILISMSKNETGELADKSHEEIAEIAGVSVSTVQRGIEELVDRGAVERVRVKNRYGMHANQYRVLAHVSVPQFDLVPVGLGMAVSTPPVALAAAGGSERQNGRAHETGGQSDSPSAQSSGRSDSPSAELAVGQIDTTGRSDIGVGTGQIDRAIGITRRVLDEVLDEGPASRRALSENQLRYLAKRDTLTRVEALEEFGDLTSDEASDIISEGWGSEAFQGAFTYDETPSEYLDRLARERLEDHGLDGDLDLYDLDLDDDADEHQHESPESDSPLEDHESREAEDDGTETLDIEASEAEPAAETVAEADEKPRDDTPEPDAIAVEAEPDTVVAPTRHLAEMVLEFVRDNRPAALADVVAAFPDAGRAAIATQLERLTAQRYLTKFGAAYVANERAAG